MSRLVSFLFPTFIYNLHNVRMLVLPARHVVTMQTHVGNVATLRTAVVQSDYEGIIDRILIVTVMINHNVLLFHRRTSMRRALRADLWIVPAGPSSQKLISNVSA
jgi:hypothetical protein